MSVTAPVWPLIENAAWSPTALEAVGNRQAPIVSPLPSVDDRPACPEFSAKIACSGGAAREDWGRHQASIRAPDARHPDMRTIRFRS